jgi:hypothetical protein
MTYLGTQPNDVKKNTGLYTPSEILQLEKDGHWGGSLELIEEQTFSGAVANIDFTSIQENKYDVHFMSAKVKFGSGNADLLGLRFYESGVLETASVYQIATQIGRANGSFGEARQTAYSWIFAGETTVGYQNLYIYFYNLGNSSKYSFCTFHTQLMDSSNISFFRFGGAVLPQASTVDGIRLFGGVYGENIGEAFDIKLYGVKQI